jgi:hypothetical protein
MSKNWKYQAVITCLKSSDELDLAYDGTIAKGSLNLHLKALGADVTSESFEVSRYDPYWNPRELMRAWDFFRRVNYAGGTPKLRVYIRGHGDYALQKVGGLDAGEWAGVLKTAGMIGAGVVSVTGCQAARDLGTSGPQRTEDQADSFASHFHRALRQITGVKCDVLARTEYVGVMPDGSKKTTTSLEQGQKSWGSKKAESKVRFKWCGDQQVREFVYVKPGELELV